MHAAGVVHRDIEKRKRAQESELQKTISPEPQEFRLRHKNGSTLWLDITGTPMTDDSGTFTGVMKMCADVTVRKMHEQRLRQLEKLESLGFWPEASHTTSTTY